jgi:RNA polymerase sigma-70 factor (ECF subfamily)
MRGAHDLDLGFGFPRAQIAFFSWLDVLSIDSRGRCHWVRVSFPGVFAPRSNGEGRTKPNGPRSLAASDRRLRRVVGLHLALVRHTLRRTGLTSADAEDASQDVFWILARRIDSVPEAAQRSFLVATARRVAADRRRSKWLRAVSHGLELDDRASDSPAADEQLDLRRAAALLERALATLAEPDRAVYVLSDLEQLSRSEVAEALSIPKGTVASRLRRARDACALALAQLGAQATQVFLSAGRPPHGSADTGHPSCQTSSEIRKVGMPLLSAS